MKASVKQRRPDDDDISYWSRRVYATSNNRATGQKGLRSRLVKLPYTITRAWIEDLARRQQLCPFLGVPWDFRWYETDTDNWRYPTLDRIDPSEGYVPGNIRLVSWWANRARGGMSDDEFRRLCTRVADEAELDKLISSC